MHEAQSPYTKVESYVDVEKGFSPNVKQLVKKSISENGYR